MVCRIRWLLFSCLFFVAACGSLMASGGQDSSLLSNKKAKSASVYYVRAKDRTDSLFKAAGQLSLRHSVLVTCTEQDGRLQVVLDYNQNIPDSILSRMVILDVKQQDWGLETLVTISGDSGFPDITIPANDRKNRSGLPAWISSPPVGKSFVAATGSMSHSPSPVSGFDYSDMNALGNLCKLLVKPVKNGRSTVWKIRLSGAFIARRWYDAGTDTYYSLAALPQ